MPRAILESIARHHSFAVVGHVSPDGDSLGSILALQELLTIQGKQAVAFCVDPIPDKYSYLPGIDRFVRNPAQSGHTFDCAIILDCGALARTGISADFYSGLTIINIDHHKSNGGELGLAWVDDTFAATGEMVFALCKTAGWTISLLAATALFTALSTDTGFFRFSNTSPAALRMAADLLELGVNARTIAEFTMERRSLSEICVLRESLGSLKQYLGGAIATLAISQNVWVQCDVNPDEVEGLVDYPRSIKETQVAVLFREIEPDSVRVSLRSKGQVDVSKVAAHYGGGGHARAAGCTMKSSLAVAEQTLLLRLTEEIYRDA
ncbi:MAG TPA: bifunctional oligoribonuclease/PAP phosphatase NrnA [Bacillota bacterium]|nr:bifunctional oligoribonuclease/PAP phosphatase NrnA [Bacillota bacterium]